MTAHSNKKDWLDKVLSDDFIKGFWIGGTIVFIAIVLINAVMRWID